MLNFRTFGRDNFLSSMVVSKLCLLMTVFFFSITTAQALTYDVHGDRNLYGHLRQYTWPGGNGFMMCGPAAGANSLVYLENAFPNVCGSAFVPNGDPLLAGMELEKAKYVYTYVGTQPWNFVYGMREYIEERLPGKAIYASQSHYGWGQRGSKPAWFQGNTYPKWDFIYNELVKGAAVPVYIEPTPLTAQNVGQSHYITVTGFHWDDVNEDKIIDYEEHATIDYINPATGQEHVVRIYHAGNILRFEYNVGIRDIIMALSVYIPPPYSLNGLVEDADTALEEETVLGTAGGDFTATEASDDIYESLTETLSNTWPYSFKYSYLVHEWTFDITGGKKVEFLLEAHSTHNKEDDKFVFQYSTDRTTWKTMLTVHKTSDDNIYQRFPLPSGIAGPLYVRVYDTNRTYGRKFLDTLKIDSMLVRTVEEETGISTSWKNNGSTEGLWTREANWTSHLLPAKKDKVIIDSENSCATIDETVDTEIAALTVGKSNAVSQLNISRGNLTVTRDTSGTGWITIGTEESGAGNITMTGGSILVRGDYAGLYIGGDGGTGVGHMELKDGLVTIISDNSYPAFLIGDTGTGTMNIEKGKLLIFDDGPEEQKDYHHIQRAVDAGLITGYAGNGTVMVVHTGNWTTVKAVLNCQQGETFCDDVCTDLVSDSAHCGVCTTACDTGQQCIEGFCEGEI